MSNIRVRYSGMIAFVVGITSLFTGLIFTVILTRQLSQEEFGIWSLIGGLIAFVFLIRPVIPFWNTREIARGIESGKTAIISNYFIVIIAILAYFGIASYFGEKTSVDFSILIFATLLIPVEFFRGTLVGIANGFKPQIEEYGLIIFEITKICFVIFLIYFLQLGVEGVILAMVFSSLASIVLMAVLVREKIRGEFKKELLKKWLKLFWLPIYPRISALLTQIDVTIFTLMTGSVTGLAYWASAKAVARISNHSIKVGKAIYPKLLSGTKKDYLQENLLLVFYFAFPLAGISIAFAKPALFILNPLYDVAYLVVIFLVPTFLLRSIGELFSNSLKGIENVDIKPNASFLDYLKSKLFFLPTIRNIHRGGYVAALVIMLILLVPQIESEVELVINWSILALLIQIPFSLYLYYLVRKEFSLTMDTKTILKYFIVSVFIFGVSFVIMENNLTYHIRILEFLPEFFPYLIISFIGYLGITYLIDKKTRKLVRIIISEIRIKRL